MNRESEEKRLKSIRIGKQIVIGFAFLIMILIIWQIGIYIADDNELIKLQIEGLKLDIELKRLKLTNGR